MTLVVVALFISTVQKTVLLSARPNVAITMRRPAFRAICGSMNLLVMHVDADMLEESVQTSHLSKSVDSVDTVTEVRIFHLESFRGHLRIVCLISHHILRAIEHIELQGIVCPSVFEDSAHRLPEFGQMPPLVHMCDQRRIRREDIEA